MGQDELQTGLGERGNVRRLAHLAPIPVLKERRWRIDSVGRSGGVCLSGCPVVVQPLLCCVWHQYKNPSGDFSVGGLFLFVVFEEFCRVDCVFVVSCSLQAWQRPTLPRLETEYHWRWGVSRPSSGWDRVHFSPP